MLSIGLPVRTPGGFLVFSQHAPFARELMIDRELRLVPIPEADTIAGYVPGVYAGAIPAYAVYNVRTRNAFDKIFKLMLVRLNEQGAAKKE